MKQRLTPEIIAMRVARELEDGWYVNLGIGIPALVSDLISPDKTIVYQTEHGLLGVGPPAPPDQADPELVNTLAVPVTLIPGAAIFHSADSFVMIRGGHLDATVLGAFQVSEQGDIANWMVPQRGVGSIGGAADLVTGAKHVFVAMEHTTREGQPRILRRCTYPLTGKGVVDKIFTDVAVIEVTPEGLLLREVAPGFTHQDVQAMTEPRLRVSKDLREIEI